ncbi:MAG: hypothetical protein OXF07_02895, partial [Rhodobacter sp.]|nr:hypothetical protein [Rhodobacter sp.]
DDPGGGRFSPSWPRSARFRVGSERSAERQVKSLKTQPGHAMITETGAKLNEQRNSLSNLLQWLCPTCSISAGAGDQTDAQIAAMKLWYQIQIDDCQRSFTTALTRYGRSSSSKTPVVPATVAARVMPKDPKGVPGGHRRSESCCRHSRRASGAFILESQMRFSYAAHIPGAGEEVTG